MKLSQVIALALLGLGSLGLEFGPTKPITSNKCLNKATQHIWRWPASAVVDEAAAGEAPAVDSPEGQQALEAGVLPAQKPNGALEKEAVAAQETKTHETTKTEAQVNCQQQITSQIAADLRKAFQEQFGEIFDKLEEDKKKILLAQVDQLSEQEETVEAALAKIQDKVDELQEEKEEKKARKDKESDDEEEEEELAELFDHIDGLKLSKKIKKKLKKKLQEQMAMRMLATTMGGNGYGNYANQMFEQQALLQSMVPPTMFAPTYLPSTFDNNTSPLQRIFMEEYLRKNYGYNSQNLGFNDRNIIINNNSGGRSYFDDPLMAGQYGLNSMNQYGALGRTNPFGGNFLGTDLYGRTFRDYAFGNFGSILPTSNYGLPYSGYNFGIPTLGTNYLTSPLLGGVTPYWGGTGLVPGTFSF